MSPARGIRAGRAFVELFVWRTASWARYADAEDAAAKTLLKKPVAVYVE